MSMRATPEMRKWSEIHKRETERLNARISELETERSQSDLANEEELETLKNEKTELGNTINWYKAELKKSDEEIKRLKAIVEKQDKI